MFSLQLKGTLLLLTSAVLLGLSSAHAEVVEIAYDHGLPRCFQSPKNRGQGTLLLWEQGEQYQRVITTVRIDQIDSANVPSEDRTCADWQDLMMDAYGSFPKVTITEVPTSIAGLTISDKTQLLLHEILWGANEAHPEKTGAEYLLTHPMAEFSVDTNRALTKRFGIGFTGEIYKAWLLQQPANASIYKAVSDAMPSVQNLGGPILAPSFKNMKALFVKGLGNDQKSSERYDFLPDLLGELGIPVTVIPTGGYAPVEANAQKVQAQLDATLSTGADVLIFSLSKGTIETALALSRLNAKLSGHERSKEYGRVRGFISLSGIYASSFLIDFATAPVISLITNIILSRDYENNGQTAPDDIGAGLDDLRDDHMKKFTSQILANGLPQDTDYISLVGIIPNNGLSTDSGIQPLQNGITRKFLNSGANDGYVEYPGTQFPAAWAAKNFTIPVDSSHVFIDGQFQNENLANPNDRRTLIGSLMQQLKHMLDAEDKLILAHGD